MPLPDEKALRWWAIENALLLHACKAEAAETLKGLEER